MTLQNTPLFEGGRGERLTPDFMRRLTDCLRRLENWDVEAPLEMDDLGAATLFRLAERVPEVQVLRVNAGPNQYGLYDASLQFLADADLTWSGPTGTSLADLPPQVYQVWAVDAAAARSGYTAPPYPPVLNPPLAGSGSGSGFGGATLTSGGVYLGMRVATCLGRDVFAVLPGGASGLGNAINLVTNVCPVFGTAGSGSGSGLGQSVVGITVEYTPVTIPGATTGTPFCTKNPTLCCPVSSPCCPGVELPTTLHLTISGSQAACMNGTFTLNYQTADPGPPSGTITSPSGPGWYSDSFPCTGGPTNTQIAGTVRWLLACSAGSLWSVTLICYAASSTNGWATVANGLQTTSTCSPVSITGSAQSHAGQGSPCIVPPPAFGPFITCNWTVTQ